MNHGYLPLRWVCLAASIWMTVAAQAGAEDRPKIAIVAPHPYDRLGLRLRDELTALGFDAVDVASADPSARLDALARGAHAEAAVRIVPSSSGVEVWIADRVTGKTVFREVVSPQSPGRPAPAASVVPEDLVALRTVELLRASFLEVHAQHPSRGEVPIPSQVTALAVLPSRPVEAPPSGTLRFGLDVGPALVLAPGGIGPAFALRAGVLVAPWKRFAIDGHAWIPVSHPEIERSEGQARLSIALASAGVRFAPVGMDGSWSWMIGLGVGMVRVGADGTGNGSFQGRYDTATAAWPHAKAGVSHRLWAGAHVGLDGAAGWALPRPIIRFAGQETAHLDPPVVSLSAYASVQWP